MKTRIITDSASDILEGEYENLTVLPLSITFGTATYLDGVDLTHERFYELLVEEDELPKTGQVNPYAFGQALDEVHAAGQEAVVITLSSKLSGTHQSAITAAAQAKGVVRVVDSLNVCVGERVLVECALRLAEKGLGAVEIADQICALRDRVCVVGLLDTLEYLRRGGRISAAAGAVESFSPSSRSLPSGPARWPCWARRAAPRTVATSSTSRWRTRVASTLDDGPVALGYAGLSDRLLRKYVADSRGLWEAGFPDGSLPVHTVGATIGTHHVGPGAIALAFFRKA